MSDMVMKMTDEQRRALILDLAKQQHPLDTCEIDDNAKISEGADNGAYVQALVWVSFAGTELDKEKPRWIAGYNMPGYLPDNEPTEFETFDEAKRYIISLMKQFEAECGCYAENYETAGGETAEELEAKANEYCLGAEQVNLCSSEFSVHWGDYEFWVKETK